MRILVVNCGSSSLKFKLYDLSAAATLLAEGLVEEIGREKSKFTYKTHKSPNKLVLEVVAKDHTQAVAAMKTRRETELARAGLATPCRKALESLGEHWEGLTRFVDDPRIPMDNNASERQNRGPALGRKNYYGSGALWSGRLAAMLFSLFATLRLSKINVRKWLTWFLQTCAENGGQVPADINPFLPWNMSQETRRDMALDPDDSS